MRVTENQHDGYEAYSGALKARVEAAFRSASRMSALRRVLGQIRLEAENLRPLFFADTEQKTLETIARNFDITMYNAKNAISQHLEDYQNRRWMEVIDEGKRQ